MRLRDSGLSGRTLAWAIKLQSSIFGAGLISSCILSGSVRRGATQDGIVMEIDKPQAVAFSPRGTEVAASGFGGEIKIWEPPGILCRSIQTPNRSTRRALAFSPDGKLLAAGGDEGTVQIYDVGTGKCRHTLNGHIGLVLALTFAPDGRTLATAAEKIEWQADKQRQKTTGEICLWDIATGMRSQKWELLEKGSHSLVYSPDGKALASA
jgi:WD40 repeat protein